MNEYNDIISGIAGEFAGPLTAAAPPLGIGLGLLGAGFGAIQQRKEQKQLKREQTELANIQRGKQIAEENRVSASMRANLPKFESLPYGRSSDIKF